MWWFAFQTFAHTTENEYNSNEIYVTIAEVELCTKITIDSLLWFSSIYVCVCVVFGMFSFWE